jgi:hypothetical protein
LSVSAVAQRGITQWQAHATSGEQMSLGIVAALTGLCFAGAVAAITIGLTR